MVKLLGIDIAKNVFHFHGVDETGRVVMKERVYRSDLVTMLSNLAQCRIVMEACGGAHHWVRTFTKLGHQVDLIAPQYVKPFVLRNKNDWKDAEAICVAAQQPSMRYVPKRSTEQQDIQNIHRVRERLVKSRTALVNEARGLLQEYGIVIAQGRRNFAKYFLEILHKNQSELSELALQTFYELWEEYLEIDEKVSTQERRLLSIAKQHPICQRVMALRGVGFLTATAILSTVRDTGVFRNGREMAAWLGLTPREHSTGGKQRLGGISKRGDKYLRKLLIHGARISLRYLNRYKDKQSLWAQNLLKRKGTNRSAVALANKNARIIWALLAHDQDYKVMPLAA